MKNKTVGDSFKASNLLAAIAIAIASSAPGAAAAEANAAPVTIDDLLDAEAPGEVWFSPDGKRIAYARETSIASSPTWGYDFAQLVRSRVFVAPRTGGEAKEILGDKEVRYSLLPENGWAANGSGLLLLAARPEGYGFAYWNADSGKVMHLPGRPYSFFAVFDWLADGRIVYAVQARDGRQRGAHMQVLHDINNKWRGSWNASAPQVTVSSADPVFANTAAAPGALMLADPTSGKATKLADGDYLAVSVAPDGRRVAVVRAQEKVPQALDVVTGRRGELQILTIGAGGVTLAHRYADIDVAPRDALAWSRSGERLLAVGKPARADRTAARLYRIEAGSGERREIAPAGLSFINPGAGDFGSPLQSGWIGERPVAVAAREEAAARPAQTVSASTSRLEYGETRNQRFDVYVLDDSGPKNLTAFAKASVNRFLAPPNGDSILAVADGRLWRLPMQGTAQPLTPEQTPVIAFGVDRRYPEPAVSTAYHRSTGAERVALYIANEKGPPQRQVLDLQSGKLLQLQARGQIVATAPEQTAAVSKQAEGWTTRLWLDDGDQRELAAFNQEMARKPVSSVQKFEYRHRDKTLVGWVVLPPGAKPGTRWPAVVSVYGGAVYGAEPPANTRTDTGMPVFSGQLLAAHGYAVIYPSTPLGAGSDTDVMATLAEQAVAAVDALADKGVVDPERVGVTGQSFGGFSTAAILAKRSDRFKAGVAMAGVYDWMYGYGTRALEQTFSHEGATAPEMTMVEIGQIRLAKPFWENPEAYMRNSPIFHVDAIDAPLLMLQGDLDLGVTGLPDAERMYNALVRAGKKPALARYWGEGHVAQSASAIRDQWMRITTWFGTYLRPQAAAAAR